MLPKVNFQFNWLLGNKQYSFLNLQTALIEKLKAEKAAEEEKARLEKEEAAREVAKAILMKRQAEKEAADGNYTVLYIIKFSFFNFHIIYRKGTQS